MLWKPLQYNVRDFLSSTLNRSQHNPLPPDAANPDFRRSDTSEQRAQRTSVASLCNLPEFQDALVKLRDAYGLEFPADLCGRVRFLGRPGSIVPSPCRG